MVECKDCYHGHNLKNDCPHEDKDICWWQLELADEVIKVIKEELTVISDEEIQVAADEFPPHWEIDGRQLTKVEILQMQHARTRAIAQAQLAHTLKQLEEE